MVAAAVVDREVMVDKVEQVVEHLELDHEEVVTQSLYLEWVAVEVVVLSKVQQDLLEAPEVLSSDTWMLNLINIFSYN